MLKVDWKFDGEWDIVSKYAFINYVFIKQDKCLFYRK